MPSRIHDLLASSIVVLAMTSSMPTAVNAAVLGPAATPDGAKPPSWWLKTGETRQEKGDDAGAGEAYGRALDGLSEKKKRANVGARTAMLSADAYWMAFESDDDVAHLGAAIEVLDRWLKVTGPTSRASLFPTVERTAARLAAIQQPRKEVDAALGRGDLEQAMAGQSKVLEALSVQRRPWHVGARLVLRVAGAHVEAYEQAAVEDEQIEAHRPKLLTAKESLESWQAQRPEDEGAKEGAEVDALIAKIQGLLDEGEQRLTDAALAQQQREAADQAAREEEQRRAEEAAAADAEAKSDTAGKRRTAAIVLVAVGGTAIGAGAGLLGEGLAFRAESGRQLEAEQAEADQLSEMFGDAYDRDQFDASVADYDDRVRRRNIGFIAGGSALVAGGLAASVVGIVWLVKSRGAKGARPTEQAWLVPSVSPSQVRLSLTARF